MSSTCAHCGNQSKHHCSKCGVTNYCSRECLVAHWQAGHKHECRRLRQQQAATAARDGGGGVAVAAAAATPPPAPAAPSSRSAIAGKTAASATNDGVGDQLSGAMAAVALDDAPPS